MTDLLKEIKVFAEARDNATANRIKELGDLIKREEKKAAEKSDRIDYLCKLVAACEENKVDLKELQDNAIVSCWKLNHHGDDYKNTFIIVENFKDGQFAYGYGEDAKTEQMAKNEHVITFVAQGTYDIGCIVLKNKKLYFCEIHEVGDCWATYGMVCLHTIEQCLSRYTEKKNGLERIYKDYCAFNDMFDNFEARVTNAVKRAIGRM